MRKGEIIKLSDGQEATLVVGDESTIFKNCYIIYLVDKGPGVVDRKRLTLTKPYPDSTGRRTYSKKTVNTKKASGFSTLESLLEAKTAENTKSLVATGGISSAQDIFKSLILGADLASSAGFILKLSYKLHLDKENLLPFMVMIIRLLMEHVSVIILIWKI